MVKIEAVYQGQKHCLATHEPSGSQIETDAPKDNQGLGEKFSPTDLVATALGTCILTTIAIVVERDNIDIKGATISVEKVMGDKPRKIAAFNTTIHMPRSIAEDVRRKIEHSANACPVKKSLATDIETPIEIFYDL
ncbi:MAG: OsmC family protein [Moraxellaceae bacterium]|nr:OsmC family protein [Pseudobdellovibrionaceae bacterium]